MTTVAAIDVGTNSTRLLIEGDEGTLERITHITRLGRGVDDTGRLSDEGIAVTVEVLTEYRSIMDQHAVDRVRIAATSASRDAANAETFFDAAEIAAGVRPELLSGQEEGRLAFAGATAGLTPDQGPFLVVDIGGGSTEFILGDSRGVQGVWSADMGSVRLTERYLEHDPPRPEELLACISVAKTHLDDVQREIPGAQSAPTMVGVAGTITTIAAIELGLAEYDRETIHHFVLKKDAIEDVFRTLATEALNDRRHNPGLAPARADIIVAGSAILAAVMRWAEAEEMLVSESDILDGLAADLRARP
ncbi:MAG: Ppx/GppA family phosphatase [Actinomycetia bacterium]|nr:Ppx/GppA family phosphatase [Actinomycetes bacterium]